LVRQYSQMEYKLCSWTFRPIKLGNHSKISSLRNLRNRLNFGSKIWPHYYQIKVKSSAC
jgi:hypothetical protein